METIYEIIAARLLATENKLWVDLDNGQLEHNEYRAAVSFPAVLIGIDFPGCEDMGQSGEQLCDVIITLKATSQVFDETSIAAPAQVRERAFAHNRLIAALHAKLQKWSSDQGEFSELTRVSMIKEKRADGLTCHNIVYRTQFYDPGHHLEELNKITAQPDITILK